MADNNGTQPSAQELLRQGYAKTETEWKKVEKDSHLITVELTDTEAELPPVYWLAKWYSTKKQEQDK